MNNQNQNNNSTFFYTLSILLPVSRYHSLHFTDADVSFSGVYSCDSQYYAYLSIFTEKSYQSEECCSLIFHFLSSLSSEALEVIFKSFIDCFHNFKRECLAVYISWCSGLKCYVQTPLANLGNHLPSRPGTPPPVLPRSFG